MSDNLPTETVPPALSGPDAPRYGPISPGVVVDLALIESLNLSNAEQRMMADAEAAEVIANAEARAAKLIAAAVADAEEQVADVRPLAEAKAEKIVQEARDEASVIESAARNEAGELTATAEQALSEAEARAAGIVADAEQTLSAAEDRAAEIIASAEAAAANLHRTLELDRELVHERLDSLEARETEAYAKLAEAERTLANARSEAERMTTEAGEAVDRMMRSGQMVSEAHRQAYESDQDAIAAIQAQHAGDLKELTDRYEAKVSNQNIENLELRQEIEVLREALEAAGSAPRQTGRPPVARIEPEPPARDRSSEAVSEDRPATDDEFASQWMIPESTEEIATATVDLAEIEEQIEEAADGHDDAEDHPRSPLGKATGLAPNARLVEPLKASAFRPAEDPKRRRRRKR